MVRRDTINGSKTSARRHSGKCLVMNRTVETRSALHNIDEEAFRFILISTSMTTKLCWCSVDDSSPHRCAFWIDGKQLSLSQNLIFFVQHLDDALKRSISSTAQKSAAHWLFICILKYTSTLRRPLCFLFALLLMATLRKRWGSGNCGRNQSSDNSVDYDTALVTALDFFVFTYCERKLYCLHLTAYPFVSVSSVYLVLIKSIELVWLKISEKIIQWTFFISCYRYQLICLIVYDWCNSYLNSTSRHCLFRGPPPHMSHFKLLWLN